MMGTLLYPKNAILKNGHLGRQEAFRTPRTPWIHPCIAESKITLVTVPVDTLGVRLIALPHISNLCVWSMAIFGTKMVT
jgi:hypothetical protein